MLTQADLMIPSLGECRFQTPLNFDSPNHPQATHYRTDATRVRFEVGCKDGEQEQTPLSFEEAGPRERIFFEPSKTSVAVVTCGGLSPGLNNVIRSIFYELLENYKVGRVLGIRNGYLGLNASSGLEPIHLTKEFVEPIDKLGGTILGTSRGHQDPKVMADFLEANKIDILLCLGGDGTQRGAYALNQELRARGAKVAIVGIPKTIDNDVPYVRLSFGYTTALEKAAEVIRGAHVEARNVINGIGLVKLMGRHAGFIAAGASVVSQEVDFTLVPEIPFPLEGEHGLLAALERRILNRSHAVIVVAEGAGQHLFANQENRKDSSGNLLHQDIGGFLKHKIKAHFNAKKIPFALKYLDPSYHIRSVPANTYDRYLCDQMGRNAVHAAMAGKTGMMIGTEHGKAIHVPIPTVVGRTKKLDLSGEMWRAVLESTAQPRW